MTDASGGTAPAHRSAATDGAVGSVAVEPCGDDLRDAPAAVSVSARVVDRGVVESTLRWPRGAAPDRPTALLVHGLGDTWSSWGPLASRLGRRWRVAAAELPWAVGTDHRWRRVAPPAAWLEAAVAACGEPPEVVVAHSFGAAALLDLVATRPSIAIGAAVLIAPFYLPPGVTPSWRLFDESRRQFESHIRDGLVARLGDRAGAVKPAIFERMVATVLDRIGPAGFLAVFDEYLATATLPVAEVRVPSLVISGAGDEIFAARDVAALAGAGPMFRVVREPTYDHFCHVRRPDDVARDITQFVERSRLDMAGTSASVAWGSASRP